MQAKISGRKSSPFNPATHPIRVPAALRCRTQPLQPPILLCELNRPGFKERLKPRGTPSNPLLDRMLFADFVHDKETQGRAGHLEKLE